MNTEPITYKRNGVKVTMPAGFYGISQGHPTVYQYPKGHPCHGCPYTFQTNVPSCMFPARRDGGCFWHDLKKPEQTAPPKTARQEAADKVFAFIKVLEEVKKRKGYK